MVPRRPRHHGPDFNQIINSLIVAGIIALVGLVWNLNEKFTTFTAKASYTRGIICQIAHKNDIPDQECQ